MSLSSQDTITVWDIGDDVPLRAEVVNNTGDLADPVNGVTAYYLKPGGTKTAVTLTRTATGIYEGKVTPATGEHGDWWWSAATDGADASIPKMYTEHTFHVREQVVV